MEPAYELELNAAIARGAGAVLSLPCAGGTRAGAGARTSNVNGGAVHAGAVSARAGASAVAGAATGSKAGTGNAADAAAGANAAALVHHKSRFLHRGPEGIWIQSDAGQAGLLERLIASRQPVVVTFRGGTNRLAFMSPILRCDNNFRYAGGPIALPAVLVTAPAEIHAVQRRRAFRVDVPPDWDLSVRIWRIPEYAYINDRPPAAQEIPADVCNLSEGGMGVTVRPRPDREVGLGVGDRLRIELQYRDIDSVFEGRVRHPLKAAARPTAPFHVGIQFNKLEDNLKGRQFIARITMLIGVLQREAVRRRADADEQAGADPDVGVESPT